ncbi:MucR family transcriptional regulator [Pseudodonghicola flavimaris]|uniref:MucR family transcriptional regulator n=1 Tax=Pseudodonghicola flavimaris TaxID=3050036 RepID=A0ABT7EWL2_9RHOB|nr:MucR family transcriptional regulator [Pseudodonghicola flavimaris]MDK3016734.1 MucR family transcriptional regulator [Pseudodonghicola flavimaris]
MDTRDAPPSLADTDDTRRAAEAVARVVAAYAGRSDTSADDIVALSRRLLPLFAGTGMTAVTTPTPVAAAATPSPARDRPTPALPIEQAVTDDKVYCLCCGRGFTMLKRHLKAEHGLTEDEYRALYGLPEDMPLVAPNYSERKAAYAKQVGLGKYQRDTAEG